MCKKRIEKKKGFEVLCTTENFTKIVFEKAF